MNPAKRRDSGILEVFSYYIGPHKKMFITDMVLSVIIALIDLVFPLVSRQAMRSMLPAGMFRAFFILMLILLVSYLVRAWFMYKVTVIGHAMGTQVEADMRRDIFSHMQTLSFSYYDKHRTGVLMGRITNDLFEIVELAHHGPENILTCALTLLGAVLILMSINIPLSLVLFVLAALCVALSSRYRYDMQVYNKLVKAETGDINAAIESSISGIRTAKAFANEDQERNKFHLANEEFKKAKVGFYKAMGRFHASVEMTVGIMQVAVITIGGACIMRGSMDYLDLLTFSLYVATFTTPVKKMAQFMEIYSQGMAGFERFLEVMRTEPEIRDAEDAVELTAVEGRITFRNVDFSYDGAVKVLEDVNIDIAPGETFALVGSSGGGKTTLCHLIPRFYEVTAGQVLLDGRDIRMITQDSLRRHIGIIQQDVFMFAGTIMDNIRYGRPDATDEEVMEAARKAEIYDEIMAMPEGFMSYVGERGIVLSGGQKQRVSIARVFLKNPPVLILDEATSALDSVTEARIQQSLDRLSTGRTCIVIAHRLSTVRNADRIAVIDSKNIVEQGSRRELLEMNGAYAALERAQGLLAE